MTMDSLRTIVSIDGLPRCQRSSADLVRDARSYTTTLWAPVTEWRPRQPRETQGSCSFRTLGTALFLACCGLYPANAITQDDIAASRRVIDYAEQKMRAEAPTPQPQPEPLPAPAGTVVTPSMDWRASIAKGGTILMRAGTYSPGPDIRGWNYRAPVEINASGTTIRAYPGERPIIDAAGNTYAVRIGMQRSDGGGIVPVSGVTLDGLEITGASTGVMILRGLDVTIRNCNIHDNGGGRGEKPGVMLFGPCERVTVERNRVWHNANGIQGYEEIINGEPEGAMDCVYRDNFIYANHWTDNPGNSSGCEFRFGVNCTIEGNIIYDNPDAGINGLGLTLSRVTRNAVLNNWGGGNQEGIKVCVRGGGGNLIAWNICAFNGARGLDTASGIGELVVGNTFYRNGSWGVLTQHRECMLLNNILHDNSVVGEPNGENGYKELDGTEVAGVSDYNWFTGTNSYRKFGVPLPLHTCTGEQPGLSVPLVMVRSKPDQVFHPEQVFGHGDIEVARSGIAKAFTPTPGAAVIGAGLSLAAVQGVAASNMPRVEAALDAAIAAGANATDVQTRQSVIMWRRVKAGLRYRIPGEDISGDPVTMDFAGKPVGATVNMGAIQ
jgi:hypothetical protein